MKTMKTGTVLRKAGDLQLLDQRGAGGDDDADEREQPAFNAQLARTYLAAGDPQL